MDPHVWSSKLKQNREGDLGVLYLRSQKYQIDNSTASVIPLKQANLYVAAWSSG